MTNEEIDAAAPPAEVPAERRDGLAERLGQKCIDWGAYWRAPDAHGVILSNDQALDLLRDALGVEVEIAAASATGDREEDLAVIAKLSRALAEVAVVIGAHLPDGQVVDYKRIPELVRERLAAVPAAPAADDAGEPVAWAVQLEDGTIGGFGWASMDTYPTVRKIATLREGCSYVFSYRCDSIRAPRVTGGQEGLRGWLLMKDGEALNFHPDADYWLTEDKALTAFLRGAIRSVKEARRQGYSVVKGAAIQSATGGEAG